MPLGRLAQVREHRAWVAQQGELHGKTEPAGIAVTLRHEVLVRSGQGEEPRQVIRIMRHTQQCLAFLLCQQLSALQGAPPVHQTSIMIVDGPALGDVVCGRVRTVA